MSSSSRSRSNSAAPVAAALPLLPSAAVNSAEAAAQPAGASQPIEVDSHRALIRSLQRGDPKALASVVELYRRTVFGFLRARLTDRSQADDLCQEVFIRLYLGRDKLDRASAVGPWLIGIARNVLREHVKRTGRRRESAWTELCLELDSLRPEDLASASGDGLFSQCADFLPGCLAELGQSARDAIELRYRDDWTHQQIADRLKRSEGAVKLLLHRARLALKSCLLAKLGTAP